MAQSTIVMRFPGGLSKALTLSYDDGIDDDIRLIEIMKRYGLKGTFNLNTGTYATKENYAKGDRSCGYRMTYEQVSELYAQEGIEPALHSLTHPFLETLPKAQVAYEIVKDRDNLEKQFGTIVRGMAYPFGTYSDDVVRVLEDCGICYCRTVKNTRKFDLPTDWLRLNPTCHHNDPLLFDMVKQFTESAPAEIRQPWLFYVWGHSYEFPRDNTWDRIEEFAKAVGNRDDIWYATNIEIYEYVESFKRLVFSLDMTRVKNPTAQELCFIFHQKLYTVRPGETLQLEQ